MTTGDSSITFVANPTIDAGYPAYEPYDPANSPTASLGEYGLDITNGTIHPPTEKDYMSYCGPAWISLYHHAKLAYNDAFNPRRVGVQHYQPPDLVDPYLWPWEYIPDPPRWDGRPGELMMKAQRLISILGTVDDTRAVEVKSVMRIQALATTSGAGATPYVAQLLGAQGEVLATAPVTRLPALGSGCGCGASVPAPGPFVFEAMVADVAPGAALRIVKRAEEGGRGETVWTREAPERAPVVRSFAVAINRGEGRATWQARGESALEFSPQFSKDRGRSWNGLAVGLTGTSHRFRAETLPSGSLVFRLLAHDGFHSTSRQSRPVVVPRRPPIVSILSRRPAVHSSRPPRSVCGPPSPRTTAPRPIPPPASGWWTVARSRAASTSGSRRPSRASTAARSSCAGAAAPPGRRPYYARSIREKRALST